MPRYQTQTLGFPRIGPRRELKRALSSYWKGDIDDQALLTTLREVEDHAWGAQLAAGIDRIGVGDSTLYDHVLDWAHRFGLIPKRFHELDGLDQYFAMARGAEQGAALELTKWFDTNYHYLVPEIEADFTPELAVESYLETLHRAKESLGERAVPIVLGPVTLLALSKVEAEIAEALEKLQPLYSQLLAELAAMGFHEVQLHEPALVLEQAEDLRPLFKKAYAALSESDLDLNIVTYFDDLGISLDWLVELPIDVLTLDFTRGDNIGALQEVSWPKSLKLAAGVIDGRNVWRVNADEALAVIAELSNLVPELRLSASSSLQFVPYTVEAETELPAELRGVLAFAEEKLAELAVLAQPEDEQQPEVAGWASRWQAFRDFAPS
ncbi:MAG: 5-methyltetrahydropteroyltriglutamate--homocysteine S-methyltransferase, partial [Anaerolineales bacterium]